MQQAGPLELEVVDPVADYAALMERTEEYATELRALTDHSHLSALVKAGYLRRDPSKPRAIEVVDPGAIATEDLRRCFRPATARTAAPPRCLPLQGTGQRAPYHRR